MKPITSTQSLLSLLFIHLLTFALSRLCRIDIFHQHTSLYLGNHFKDWMIEVFDLKTLAMFWGIFYLTSFLYKGKTWLYMSRMNFLIAYIIFDLKCLQQSESCDYFEKPNRAFFIDKKD